MYHGSPLMEEATVWLACVMWVEGLIDTVMPVSLPSVVGVRAVVGSGHRVLLASNTHCFMCVPLEIHSMNMKPMGKKQISDWCTVHHQHHNNQPVFLSRSHSPQVDMLFSSETRLTWLLTEQTSSPETSCFRVIFLLSLFPERSWVSVSVRPSRVQLYWGLSPPSEEQDTLISPWDRHSETSRTEDTGAEGNTLRWLLILSESWLFVSNTEQA